jgi:hypothetical protein
MNLPSFLWLWKIAAWSMGFSLLAYALLALSGGRVWWLKRHPDLPTGPLTDVSGLRTIHLALGISFVSLILVLLSIGLVGTIGHFGNLGHSPHLWAGLTVVGLTLTSAWSAFQIRRGHAWARSLHITLNSLLFLGLSWVGLSGWVVVQKYLNHTA